MGRKKSAVNCLNWEIYVQGFVWFVLIFTARISRGITNPADVAAINNLYAALGYPTLPGWVPNGGDPCAEAWQGVVCESTNIISIDLSNNHIGGSIPSNLPVTMQNIFLSANQFNGSIPSSLSTLTQLSAMSLNENRLTGEIPDAFQVLIGDLSSNNLSGRLPNSLENLSSLTTFHLQNNQLSGTLDVLQDLPLKDLNIENNLFNGPVPENLLTIPNFKTPLRVLGPNLEGCTMGTCRGSLCDMLEHVSRSFRPRIILEMYQEGSREPRVTLIAKARREGDKLDGGRLTESGVQRRASPSVYLTLGLPFGTLVGDPSAIEKLGLLLGGGLTLVERGGGRRAYLCAKKYNLKPGVNGAWWRACSLKFNGGLNPWRGVRLGHEQIRYLFVAATTTTTTTPPPPPPPHFEKVIVNPIAPTTETTERPSTKSPIPQISVKSYTIASLQQYTNSFSQENLIGAGMLGAVYRAELPNGKLLAIKKLDKRASSQQKDEEFLDLVNSIDQIRHANVVELMGYCAEHGQRLLIYEYCSSGTLQDALHSDDEFKRQLTWNIRIRMALGAARALEYLHEVCEPPIIHRNFKSANVLLDDDLTVHVSDCGLASLISSGSVSQLSGNLLTAYGYGAPEFESGIYTLKSDVFSFGVVMLELLTGRQSHDRTRNRGEQFLVRWAIPQLHDIDALSSMVDPSLNGEYPAKSLSHFADVISRCVQPEPEFRPPMSEVVQDLLLMIRRESPRRFGGD
ncbi:STRUBBELIG-receptor family 3 [Actinidia rufa]|uniref:STRUBBELIG-receptor family 3 n=2 Tax=Actinidia TaxID=3624 RepID=A0A7J0G4D9_9ERIC|nr:STRUBBELIG-receptor family 3 [Actinidia rufa]